MEGAIRAAGISPGCPDRGFASNNSAVVEWGAQMMTKQPTLTKADLIAEVERVTELKRTDSETIVETIFESIIEALQKGDKIEIRGFGSFRTRQRRGRVGRNPKTGAKVEVPPKKIPFFKPSKELKDFVNHPDDGTATGAGAASASTTAPGQAPHS
jgi:integration host factor subunit beta